MVGKGASRSDLWMQIIADEITRLPVYTIVQEVEAALGAALLAAHAVGTVSDEAMDKGWVHLALRAERKAQNAEVHDWIFAEYVKLYPALRPIMQHLRAT
ncbi:FGGY-family carbohydrate kinase [Pseudomonas sp. H2_E05]